LALLRVHIFTANLGALSLFADLRDFANAEGQRVGKEFMKPYFDRENLGVQLGSLHKGLLMHDPQGNDIKTQEAFIREPILDGSNGTLILRSESFEAEVVYIHVLRMVAMVFDKGFQAFVRQLADDHGGTHRGVPIKGVGRMWTKLQSRDDHRFLTAAQKTSGRTRRSGQNIDINRCAVTFTTVKAFKVRCRIEEGVCLGGSTERSAKWGVSLKGGYRSF
jgi:hypothetical protein